MTDAAEIPVAIRRFAEADIPLIIDSWLQTAAYHSPTYFFVPRGTIFRCLRPIVETLIAKRPDLFRVAVNSEDPDQIFGWACVEQTPEQIHFLYVKERFRGKKWGIASRLLEGLVTRRLSWWSKSCSRHQEFQYFPENLRRLYNGTAQNPARSYVERPERVRQDGADHQQQ